MEGEAALARYVLAFRGGSAPNNERQAIQLRDAWNAWLGSLGAALVDPGGPFGSAMAVGPDAEITMGSNAGLSGYTIVMADSLAAAAEMAARSPIFSGDGDVDVYEALGM
jgi:hypothetical protein